MGNFHGLIVDVGMHRGDDTEFYLRKGFQVVAIEADPVLVDEARQRFVEEIASGSLEILHCAVAKAPGTVTFFRSSREGWGSIDPARAGSATGAEIVSVDVPAGTYASLMAGRGRPHFVKIDIEGADRICLESLVTMAELPAYLSFEADLSGSDAVELVDRLHAVGYRDFMLVNQALNPGLRAPNPPLEGDYVDANFTHETSGLFGRELAGAWVSAEDAKNALSNIAAQQQLRNAFATSGKVFGVPMGRLHGPLKALYNAGPVRAMRHGYANLRGQEVGGWFDVHARLMV